jgi:hypothetical protein
MKRLKLLTAAILTATGACAALPALAVGNLADIAIHDRATGRDLPVYWHEGRAYVVGKPGNEYQVTVRNRAGEDVLAVVSVDGVNVVSGETANAKQSGYVMSPHESTQIRGWRKSLGETAAFYFTSLGDSYAARTGRPNNVGVIGAALFRRKPVEYQPPVQSWIAPGARKDKSQSLDEYAPKAEAAAGAMEPDASGYAQKRAQSAPAAPLGTGHGRRESSQAQYVGFDRATEYPAETVAIYYDSYPNLVARGILARPPVPRDPQPFPGFAPDPVSHSPFISPYPGG